MIPFVVETPPGSLMGSTDQGGGVQRQGTPYDATVAMHDGGRLGLG